MSTGMTPYISVPQGFTPKSFWQRPEGGAGKGLIYVGIAAAGVAAFWFWGQIVPFVEATLANTVMACVYGGILIVIGSIALGGPGAQIRLVIKNAFQSFSRLVARMYTTIDPIGILNNNLDDMKKEKATLDQTVQRFAGSESMLQRNIAAKQQEAQKAYAMSQQAAKMAASEIDPLKKQQLTLQSGTDEENAGMLLQGVQQLKALEADTSKLLTTFQQWSMVSDAKIQRTANKVGFLTTQRKMIIDAKSTLSIGQRLLKGNSQQEQMVDMALDYLEEDTSRTLGEIRDFSRFTDKLLTNDQIESGANAELARQQFAEFSAKLLTSGSTPAGADLIQIPGVSSPTPVPVARAVAAGAGAGSDDFDPFK